MHEKLKLALQAERRGRIIGKMQAGVWNGCRHIVDRVDGFCHILFCIFLLVLV